VSIAPTTRNTAAAPEGTGTRKSPRQARAQITVASILEATAQLLARSDTLTTNRIAERAGVSIGTLYQYFEDKRGILNALFEQEFAASQAQWPQAPLRGRPGPLAVRLCTALCTWWAEPVRKAVIEQLTESDLRAFRLRCLGAVVAHLELWLSGHPELEVDQIRLTAAVHGAVAALLYAGPDGGLAPSQRANTARELAILVLGPLSCPTQRWRAATHETPSSLGYTSGWSLARSPGRAVRQWLRARPRQGRAQASVAAIISTAGELFVQGADYTAERLAAGAGVSVGTVYRYFADKHFALGEFGIALLTRYTERVLSTSTGLRPRGAQTVQRLVYLTLDPMRHSVARRLRIAMYTYGERGIIHTQLDHMNAVLSPSVLRHPLCGVDAAHLPWMLHAMEGITVWLTEQAGLHAEPMRFGALVEAAAQMVFTYCSADRPIAWAILDGTAP
jgi:AcrR family transcriptional regulator